MPKIFHDLGYIIPKGAKLRVPFHLILNNPRVNGWSVQLWNQSQNLRLLHGNDSSSLSQEPESLCIAFCVEGCTD